MEKTIYKGYYNAFMKTLHSIELYSDTKEAKKKRLTMINNLGFAVAQAYNAHQITWDMARFYSLKIADYTRNCKM